VLGDSPEIFWCTAYVSNNKTVSLSFRCKNAAGNFDTAQVNRKRKELKKAAKYFTRGISRRTDPYEALLTIYRRLILCTDYDTIGLNAGIDDDNSRDDPLRSLHSALVDHKVVCAGYSIAMLYLMQSIGIVAADVTSEQDEMGDSHAFNILKLGRYCYYLDATWGDPSNTKTGSKDQDRIKYDYVCVPYDEFIQTAPESVPMHQPSKHLYPSLETFRYTSHEYFRYRNAYLRSYNEAEIARIIADAAMNYDRKELGDFAVGIRFPTENDATVAMNKLLVNGNLSRLVGKAKESLKKKEHLALLEGTPAIWPTYSGVLYIRFS
jgi:transglutaminase/protease-like cytokinesis protein 3